MSKKRIVIIGGGFGGLAAAALLAHDGHDVQVFDKNAQLGGRAGKLVVGKQADGTWQALPDDWQDDGRREYFRFDTGPSWYLMPDVFEHFFAALDEKADDYFSLTQLTPSYRVFFKDLDQQVDMTSNLSADMATFESIESGAGNKLKKYLDNAAFTYDIAVGSFLRKNYDSFLDFITPVAIRHAHRMHITLNMDKYVRRYFKDARLQKILQYPLVFLGSSPYNAPALYNLMSHVDFTQGVFYPDGGMYKVVEALQSIGAKHGVRYQTDAIVERIVLDANGAACGVVANGQTYDADIVISDADIHHTEQALLPAEHRDHSDAYWESRTLAPSALLMYLGVDKTYDSILHHSLLFSKDWPTNFAEIFDTPRLPTDPSIYVSATSKTDPLTAPEGYENIFVLVPIAPGLELDDAALEAYADNVLATMEIHMDMPDLRKHIVYKQLRGVQDFATRYNSYKGTGLGLAHTLRQTAIFRPSNKSKKVKNLFYVGANVHPGIGVPVTLISAELVRERVQKTK